LTLHTKVVVTDERLETATQDRVQEWLGDADLSLVDVEADGDQITVEVEGRDDRPGRRPGRRGHRLLDPAHRHDRARRAPSRATSPAAPASGNGSGGVRERRTHALT